MAMQPFTNFGVSSYISSLPVPELRVFADNLNRDFDGTIFSTFALSPSQLNSLAATPLSAKMNVASGIDAYTRNREAGLDGGAVDVSGLDPAGSDKAICGIRVSLDVTYDSATDNWTISIKIEITKSNSSAA